VNRALAADRKRRAEERTVSGLRALVRIADSPRAGGVSPRYCRTREQADRGGIGRQRDHGKGSSQPYDAKNANAVVGPSGENRRHSWNPPRQAAAQLNLRITTSIPRSGALAIGQGYDRLPQGQAVLHIPPLISVIDDDASFRIATDSLLRAHGYTVHAFASAAEFLRSPEIDETCCVIADVQMPAMSGIELQSLLRKQGRSVPFISSRRIPKRRSACER